MLSAWMGVRACGAGRKRTTCGDAPTGPVKTALEPKEIKAGKSAVAGAAQACYGANGVAGHVKVKATVAPSGSVTKVDATGEFAGTPTGACVAAANGVGLSVPVIVKRRDGSTDARVALEEALR